MKKILIKKANALYELKSGLNIVVINNIELYRKIYYELEEEIIFSIDNSSSSISKNIYIINNPLELNINDKKNITYLYKIISNRLNKEFKEEYLKITNELLNLLNDTFNSLDFSIDYEIELEQNKLFQGFDIRYKDLKHESYLEYLIKFIKCIVLVLNINTFITYGLSNYLTKEEIDIINKELQLLNIDLIDFITFKKEKMFIENSFVIDENLCII